MGIFNKLIGGTSKKSTTFSLMDRIAGKRLGSGNGSVLSYDKYSPYFKRALDKRSEKVGEIRWYIEKNDEAIKEDPWLELLYNPNEDMTGSKFWGLYQRYMDTIGKAYIWVVRNNPGAIPTELHLLNPTKVSRLEDSYQYNGKNFDAEDILYNYNPDPRKITDPCPIINEGGKQILEAEKAINEYHAKVIKNGGKVDTLLNIDDPDMTQERLKEMEKQIERKMEASSTEGKPLLFSGKITSEKLGLTPGELEYLQTKRVILEDIAIMTGVPASMLSSYADTKYSNAEHAIVNFLREYIKPQLDDLTNFLNRKLLPEDKPLAFIDPTPQNVEQKLSILESSKDSMSINERRAFISTLDDDLDLEDKENADEIMVPLGQIPNEGKSTGRHPLANNRARRHAYGYAKVKSLEQNEKSFKRVVDKYFRDQQKRIEEKIENKKSYTKNVSDVFNKKKETELAVSAFLPALEKMAKDSGQETIELLQLQEDFEMTTELRKSMNERTELLAKSINDTTAESLKADFDEAMQTDAPFTDFSERVSERYDQMTEGRALTIARTETHFATMRGTMESYNQTGVKTKIWTALFANTRSAHAAADGQERHINEPFDVGGERIMFPGQGSPSNAINCQCVI